MSSPQTSPPDSFTVRVEPGQREADFAPAGAQPGRATLSRRWPWIAGLVIAFAWDRAVYLHVAIHDAPALAKLETADWYRTLRIVGAPYIWVFVAALLILIDAERVSRESRRAADSSTPGDDASRQPAAFTNATAPFRRATFLLLSALLSGAAAEVLKGLVGRYKPDTSDGLYQFATLHTRFVEWKWNDLGFASSHAAIAFGACFALSIMMPRGTIVFLLLAIGCSVSRLLAGAHFLSDTYAAVLLAFLVTQGIYWLDRRNNAGRGIDDYSSRLSA